jgi:nucleotide-binding universal stress UspA family protein
MPEFISMGVERVTLAYVMDTHYPRAPNPSHVPHYEERLRELAQPLEEAGLSVDVEVRMGDPARELLAAGAERGATLIVIGSHGQGIVNEALLGSVAASVIQQSTLPVLILAVSACDDESTLRCRIVRADLRAHLLHPTDFSDVAERAYGYVAQLAANADQITLLHVQDVRRAMREQREHISEYDRLDLARLERMRADLKARGAREVEARIEHGEPGEKIIEVALESEASLIVMGSQGRGYLSEVMLGSASRHVTRNARRTVLLVPAPR